MDEKLKIYKLGHNENDELHLLEPNGYKVLINNNNENSKFYNPLNQYMSEFSAIRDIDLSADISSGFTHIGLCHYRTTLNNNDTFESYKQFFDTSYGMNLMLIRIYGAVLSNYEAEHPLKYGIARWSGSRTIDLIKMWFNQIGDIHKVSEFDSFLSQNKYNNKTLCVLPIDYMAYSISMIRGFSMYSLEKRLEYNELYPRSVGYDCECMMGFLLYHYEKINKSCVSVSRVTIENGKFRYC